MIGLAVFLLFLSHSELQSIVSDHPNIVSIHNSYEDEEGIMWICMAVCHPLDPLLMSRTHKPTQQLCDGGDLKQCLKDVEDTGERMGEPLIWNLFSQLVSAVQYCHEPDVRTGDNPDPRTILHRDLKPENSKYLQVSP
jgi:serine/threonine protein kinase